MKNLKLKIIHSGTKTGSPRLCDQCIHGLVHRGEGMEFAWCSYMQEYVSVRVEECNRFTSAANDQEEISGRLIAQYTID